jgi:hypothetical protein
MRTDDSRGWDSRRPPRLIDLVLKLPAGDLAVRLSLEMIVSLEAGLEFLARSLAPRGLPPP